MKRTMLKACVVTIALAAMPAFASAHQMVALGGVAERERGTNPEELENRAKALFESPSQYGQAAKLYLEAADLRAPGDPQRVTDLQMASRLTYYNKKVERAAQIMERAADEALAAGDVVRAAHTYIDASFLWRDAGNNEIVPDLVKKAQLLTSSPLMAKTDRSAILSRIEA